MTINQLSSFLNKLYNKTQLTDTEVIKFIEHVYKKLNPDKVCNVETIKKLFSIEQFLHIVIKYYVDEVEADPKKYGLTYTKIYTKDNILLSTVVKTIKTVKPV